MSYISYNNVRALLSVGDEQSLDTSNYHVMYATDFNASNSTALKRVKRIGQVFDYYIQTGPKSALVSANIIPVTGVGVNQVQDFLALTGDFHSGSFIQVPSYRFEKCFLKNLTMSFEPWKAASMNLQFDSYGLATGSGVGFFTGVDAPSPIISPLRGVSIVFSTTNFTQTISEYENISFGVEVERLPNTEIGSAYPIKVSVARIAKTLQLNGISNIDWLSDYQPNTSVEASITMPNGYSISVVGVLSDQQVTVDNSSAAKASLTIVQEAL